MAATSSAAGWRLNRRAAIASLAVAATLVLAKLGAWLITDSIALLTSLVDSGIDLLASLVTFDQPAPGGAAGRPGAPLRPRQGRAARRLRPGRLRRGLGADPRLGKRPAADRAAADQPGPRSASR